MTRTRPPRRTPRGAGAPLITLLTNRLRATLRTAARNKPKET
ncbi:hypothetical protein [Streptomyces sp. SPB074]|nr:hypothetical protein [Streptomyces sp. SPB074]EDY45632.1 hypothetical protein SSBG_03669 [Streptomyces sp. SPB074]